MRMLKKLKEKLPIMKNEWEFNFVEGLVIQMEEGRDFKEKPISDAQFAVLVKINNKYDGGD